MKILIYSDPHIGLKRAANTSLASSLRLKEKLLDRLQFVSGNLGIELGCRKTFCLGDLFDKFSNPEEVIRSASVPVSNTDLILAGNHDMENRAGSVGSLQLYQSLTSSQEKILINTVGEKEVFHVEQGLTQFLAVPHVSDQSLFCQALEEAAEFAETLQGWKVLLLHCNYNLTYENLPDTALNLTKELTEEMLTSFHKIFIGHEHIPSSHYDGRVVLLGNLHPTGFSDISEKRVLVYDTDTGEYQSHSLGEDYIYKGKASLAEENIMPFMDLSDDLPVGEANKKVTKLFKNPEVLAIRLRASVDKKLKQGKIDRSCLQSLPEIVAADLEHTDPELFSLWEEMKNAVS